MSQEHQPRNHEQSKQLESIRGDLEKIAQNKHEKEVSKTDKEHGQAGQVEQLRSSAEQHAKQIEAHAHHAEKEPSSHPIHAGKREKNIAYDRTLTRIRKKLSVPSRAFSKVVHNKAIDAASEVVGNSVARPSGMLGGAVVAFVGTSALLWITRRLGYEYNYLMVIILFGIGMAAGLAFEAFYKTRKQLK